MSKIIRTRVFWDGGNILITWDEYFSTTGGEDGDAEGAQMTLTGDSTTNNVTCQDIVIGLKLK